MKSVLEYITESIQINEAFECDILTRASKSIKELSKIQKEKYPNSSPSTFKLFTLKQFLQYSYVPASKLTNDMVEKIESAKDIKKEIRAVIKGSAGYDIAIGFKNGLLHAAAASVLTSVYVWPAEGSYIANRLDKLLHGDEKQYMKIAPFEECDEVYIIRVPQEIVNAKAQQKRERIESQRGIIYQGDAYFYSELARENRERYNKIIAKRKAELQDDTELIANYKELMKKVVKISSDVASNIDKYADKFITYQYLMSYINSTQWYDTRDRKMRSFNGVLSLLQKYLDTKKDVKADGGYSHQRKDVIEYRKQLEAAINKANEYVNKFNAA